MGLREKRKASASWLVSRIATQPLTRVLSGIAVVALFVVGFGTAGADRFAVSAPPPRCTTQRNRRLFDGC